jgi:hypothetical protein
MEPYTPELPSELALTMRNKVYQFRDETIATAEKIVFEKMPAKLIQLDSLFKTLPEFNVKHLSDIEELPATTVTATVMTTTTTTPSEQQDQEEDKKTILHLKSKRKRASNVVDEQPDTDGLTTTTTATTNATSTMKSPTPKSTQSMTTNTHVDRMVTFIKDEVLQLIDMCNHVKIWIQMNIPRIEDGNNFGVSIQEETVAELSRTEDSGLAVLESITKYYVTRGKLCSKIIKYPFIEDYWQSIRELDEKEYTNLKLCSNDLRNSYAILYDMILKNLDKIKKPRSSHAVSLY